MSILNAVGHSLVLVKICPSLTTSTTDTSPTQPFLPPLHYLQLDLFKNVVIGSLRSSRTSLVTASENGQSRDRRLSVLGFRIESDSGVKVDPYGLIGFPRLIITAVRFEHRHGVVHVHAATVVVAGVLPENTLLLLVPVPTEVGAAASVP